MNLKIRHSSVFLFAPKKDSADEEEDWDLPGEVVGNVVQQAEQLQVGLLEQVPCIERDIGLNHRYRFSLV